MNINLKAHHIILLETLLKKSKADSCHYVTLKRLEASKMTFLERSIVRPLVNDEIDNIKHCNALLMSFKMMHDEQSEFSDWKERKHFFDSDVSTKHQLGLQLDA